MENQVAEILDRTGLNWKVRTEKVQTESGIILPDKIAIIREDNNYPLGDHKKGYTPYQNEDLLELLFQISTHTGLQFHSGGYFGHGEKVWFQLKSDDLRLKNDKIEGYVSGINSFDGSTSLSFGNANKTISCMNTFWFVYKSLQTKMKHSISMLSKIEVILANIDVLVKEEQHTFQKIQMLADFKVNQDIIDTVTRQLFDINRGDSLDLSDKNELLSTNKKNKIERFYLDLNGELKSKEDSLWGLFSGVTKYTTHTMNKGDNTENKIFGRVGVKEREIFNELFSLVG